jgi:hypothetical protein
MNLKHLTDKELVKETKRLVQSEREITTEVLHHIKEIDSRKLFSDYGHSSMMSYAIKELNYSESAAARRIQSARMLGAMPEIENKINDGTLSLSNLSKAAGFFNRENIKEPSKRKAILKEIENKSARECEKTLLEMSPTKPLPRESVKIVTPEFHQLKINVSESTLKHMNDAKELLGKHAINDEFMDDLSKEALENIKRKKFKITDKPRVTESTSRIASNQTKRDVLKTSNGVCEKCGSLFMLQFDHREPWALGGKSEASNMRLLCFHCNQRARIRSRL